MIKNLLYGKVLKSRLIFDNPNDLSIHISKFEGKDVQVTIETKRKRRSKAENSYYWAVVVKMVSEHCGYTEEEGHEALKMKFLIKSGDKLDTCKSTTDLSTIEMEDYLREIRIFMALEFGLNIPEPNESIEWS